MKELKLKTVQLNYMLHTPAHADNRVTAGLQDDTNSLTCERSTI